MANVTMVRIRMVAAATLLVELTLNEPTGRTRSVLTETPYGKY